MIRAAISPCPNDTFAFEALINNRIDTEGLEFEFTFHDVETLNRMAMEGSADMLKVSFFAWLHVRNRYLLLDAGSAMGFGHGPLLISREEHQPDDLPNLTVAVPGEFTTAHMLYRIFSPGEKAKQFMVFSEIEEAVLTGRADAGVIIHENRFTYAQKGLKKMVDLGEYWEQLTGSPVPLGGIIASNDLGYDVFNQLNRVVYRSVKYAIDHPDVSMPFVTSHAQEMEEEVMLKHIGLYVNANTLSLGTAGRVALARLEAIAAERGMIPRKTCSCKE
jgi:1,4-dihydroxy-6-naphthoate synthase